MHFLIIKQGQVYDPLTKEYRQQDLAIRDNSIVPLELIDFRTADVIDAKGCIVVPGLIDYHIHLYTGCDGGVNPDLISIPSGVTTAVDGGSCGASGFEMFKHHNIDTSSINVLSYLHVASGGLSTSAYPENLSPEYYEEEKIIELFKKYPHILKALKFRISKNILGEDNASRKPLERTIEIAEKIGCPVVVHVNDPVIPQEELVQMLRPGDVFCHMYQGQGDTILNKNGRVKNEIRKARERGVVFDASNGKGNFSFDVAIPALEDGFYPDILSSDISPITFYKQPAVSIPRLMSKYLALGLDIKKVIDLVTIHPANQLGLPELGTLQANTVADIAILKVVEKPMKFYDVYQKEIAGDCYIEPQMTIKNGKIIYCQAGFN